MKSFSRKLCSAGGETLVETLLSILITALACAVFASMTLASSHLNATAVTEDAALYAELTAAETQSGSISDTVTVSWGAYQQDFSVLRSGSAGELMSYAYAGGGG